MGKKIIGILSSKSLLYWTNALKAQSNDNDITRIRYSPYSPNTLYDLVMLRHYLYLANAVVSVLEIFLTGQHLLIRLWFYGALVQESSK